MKDSTDDMEKNPDTKRTDIGDDGEEQSRKTTSHTMPISEFMEMIRSLFKIMIHGVSHDRLVVIMQEALSNGKFSIINKDSTSKNLLEKDMDEESRVEFEIYKKLVTQTYDLSEYRLPLWLPLSIE